MIFSDFTYAGITFSRFVRGSGYQATSVNPEHTEIRSTKDANTGFDGIQQYYDFYGVRLVTIEGFIKGISESDLYAKVVALEKALDIHALEAMGNYGFQPLIWTDPGQGQAIYYLKPITQGIRRPSLTINEARTGLSRSFSILLEAKDPKKYQSAISTYTITPGVAGGSGSSFPNLFPMVFSGTSFSGTLVINNSGASNILPNSIVFNGPVTGAWQAPQLTNETSGAFLGFSSAVSLNPGDTITVNPQLGTVYLTLSGTTTLQDLTPYITAGSTLFPIVPGNNTLQITGANLPSTAFVTITTTNAF